jgi:hypothetical protein
MLLPQPRGELTFALVHALRRDDPALLPTPQVAVSDPLTDDDLQLALWICYELHYRGFDDVVADWEWQPGLIAFRTALEDAVLASLRERVEVPSSDEPVASRLRLLVDEDDGPSLSRYMQRQASRAQFLEFAMHRSIYQLKEADPHSWAIPRLPAAAKAALVEIQADEYGAGRPERMHSELYRGLLRSLDLDDSYGAYIDEVPGITLALSNVMSMFGLRRTLRGALVGHLAAYEMTSSAPCRRYAQGLRRACGDGAGTEFFDVHVTADALHEQLAAHDLCGGLAGAEPQLIEDIVFGAATCLYVDALFAEHVLGRWSAERTSLREDAGAARLAS